MIGLTLGSEHRSYKGPYDTATSPLGHKPVRSRRASRRVLAFRAGAVTALLAILPAAAVLAG